MPSAPGVDELAALRAVEVRTEAEIKAARAAFAAAAVPTGVIVLESVGAKTGFITANGKTVEWPVRVLGAAQ